MNNVERIKGKWARGKVCVGTAVTLTDSTVVELLGEAGFDFVWIDMEHSAMTIADASAHVRAARASGTAAWIRVPSDDPVVVKPILELHPAGIIVPRIDSAKRAEAAVRSCRYPPRGVRGFGPSRGVRYGLTCPSDYLAQVDEQMMVILQIEHIDAIKDIDNIVSANHTHGPFVIEAAEGGAKLVTLEKPPVIWPGYEEGREASAEVRKRESMEYLATVLDAVRANGTKLLYAENFIYVSAVFGMVNILEQAMKTGKGKILHQ